MSSQIDSVSIEGLKKADVYQLREIFYDFKESGVYWGRKDYWDKRMKRLEIWLDSFEHLVSEKDVIIKEKR